MSKEDDELSPRKLCDTVSATWAYAIITVMFLLVGIAAATNGDAFLAIFDTAGSCGTLAVCIHFWRDALRRADRIQKALKPTAPAQGGESGEREA